jgi:hypothetical protein
VDVNFLCGLLSCPNSRLSEIMARMSIFSSVLIFLWPALFSFYISFSCSVIAFCVGPILHRVCDISCNGLSFVTCGFIPLTICR